MAKSDSVVQPQVPTSLASRVPPDPTFLRSENEQVDFCWRVIQRFDGYINATNTKAANVLTFNSFVFATVVLKWGDISQSFGHYPVATEFGALLLLVCAVASVVSLWFGLNAIVPVLNSPKEPNKYHSLVFFGHVAEFSNPEAYAEAVRAGTTASAADDLAKQAHALAKIAAKKFWQLTWAARLIVFVQLPAFFLMILTVVIVTLLKNVSGGQP